MICHSGNALTVLFDHAKEQLPDDQLQWLTNLGEAATMHCDNVAETLNSLACVLSADETISKPGDKDLACILWGLHDSLRSVSASVFVSDEARAELDRRQIERAATQKTGNKKPG
ncbi:hypothetical protein [Methylotuvimicrobium buryatense]|uniref:Uncharacterized protein n=1 Tax=Methylotuvimicrobium buryatense TaxID=95641 RepID=A0A4P9US80_METBY|nr:hypothetical protein [Methylotuvimicrobium buryatense]QCW84374.1 hypothetical protein EQU24_20660 [Methylotuvimicrobium buryatense]